MSTTRFDALFTPFQLGKFVPPNRFVFPPMGLEVCEGGIPGDDAAEYYARRARGGTSLVVTEGAFIDHHSSGDNPMRGRFHGEDAFDAWRNDGTKVHP
jgi:2,4-dienoyl-CoA reductase-like NADH-dependent reductase (Old Yellow Enzyme family)